MADQKEQQPMRVDGALLRELAELLATNDLTEIEVEDGDRKIKVRRESAPVMAAPSEAAAPAAAPADAVKSPMVGTAFLSPEPGAKPFIAPGQTVKAGDTLLIIEAMKVMNQIRSPRAGTVTQIMVRDGAPVEYGEPLLVVA
jgi:acetyl-CoA carboxylase biotin carboxyl carrier protein